MKQETVRYDQIYRQWFIAFTCYMFAMSKGLEDIAEQTICVMEMLSRLMGHNPAEQEEPPILVTRIGENVIYTCVEKDGSEIVVTNRCLNPDFNTEAEFGDDFRHEAEQVFDQVFGIEIKTGVMRGNHHGQEEILQ